MAVHIEAQDSHHAKHIDGGGTNGGVVCAAFPVPSACSAAQVRTEALAWLMHFGILCMIAPLLVTVLCLWTHPIIREVGWGG